MLYTVLLVLMFSLAVSSQRGCPIGSVRQQDSCYTPIRSKVTYYAAEAVCRSFGGHIVWLTRAQDLPGLNALADQFGLDTHWLGLRLVRNQWIWSDSRPLDFSNWNMGQPDRCCGPDITCVVVNYIGNGKWDDTGCNHTPAGLNGYICRTLLPQ